MRSKVFYIRTVALVLALALLSSRIGAYSHHAFAEPIQNFFSNKDQVTVEPVKKSSVFCKTKKLSELFPPAEEKQVHSPPPPDDSCAGTTFSDAVPDGVREDIFIPPESHG